MDVKGGDTTIRLSSRLHGPFYLRLLHMEQESIFVGLDVAKAQVDVAIRPADDRWEVSHDDSGIGQLVSQLKSLELAMVLVEASGGLELPLVSALATEELPVVVV